MCQEYMAIIKVVLKLEGWNFGYTLFIENNEIRIFLFFDILSGG